MKKAALRNCDIKKKVVLLVCVKDCVIASRSRKMLFSNVNLIITAFYHLYSQFIKYSASRGFFFIAFNQLDAKQLRIKTQVSICTKNTNEMSLVAAAISL